jgi:CubicO group peptidase (beta-lactamase class C family)
MSGNTQARLDVLRLWLATNHTTGLVVSVGGKIWFEYGDVTHVSKVASVRKSILAILYGKYVAQGTIDLDKTLAEIGVEDVQSFLPVEKDATIRHVLAARSGVYLSSGNANLTDLSPRRGSQAPGTYFQYQNWDFNVAGAIFEKLTKRDIFAALEADLARPIGMQDFDRRRQEKHSALPDSKFPEYAMYLSTRDMARLGLLMLRGGTWQGAQLIPERWCRLITTLVTPQTDVHPRSLGEATWARRWGYGLLWWVWDAPNLPRTVTGPYQGAYTAWGAYGQYITVLPVLDMVVAHTVAFDEADEKKGLPIAEVSPEEYDAILGMLVAAAP